MDIGPTNLDLLTDQELLRLSPYSIAEINAADKLGACPVIPHRREQEFLDIQSEEVMYGGAVGGGKTEAGMLWLAQGVQHAGFSGLFLRRTFSQLQGSPTSPIERSFKFFSAMGGHFAKATWTFPNGAAVRFGHMQHENDKHNYDGPEFHRVFFDQVEQFSETQYVYMFSRLRRTVGFPIGCGIRSSSNPIGGHWVRNRFVSPEAIEQLKQYTAHDQSPAGMMFKCPGTDGWFVPSRIADNPSLEVDEYIARLRGRLGGVLAAKLANGDWSAVEGAVIDVENLRYYTTQGDILKPLLKGKNISQDRRAMRRFATIDTAGTSKQKAAETRGKAASYSVCAIWDHWPAVGLFLRHLWRGQVGWPALKNEVQRELDAWGAPKALIENAHHGPVLAGEIRNSELVPVAIHGMSGVRSQRGVGSEEKADRAKYDRAIASGLLAMIEGGQIYLPDVATVKGAAGWLPEFEAELLSWTGAPGEQADQVDVCSHAAYHVRSRSASWGGVVDTINRTHARW